MHIYTIKFQKNNYLLIFIKTQNVLDTYWPLIMPNTQRSENVKNHSWSRKVSSDGIPYIKLHTDTYRLHGILLNDLLLVIICVLVQKQDLRKINKTGA